MAGPRDDPKAGSEGPESFEGHLDALERVVGDLEGDALSLEASIERYRVGVDHLSACRRILDAAERRLAELVAKADGSGVVERPLEVGPDGLVDASPAAAAPRRAAAPRTPRRTSGSSGAARAGDDDEIPV